MVRYRNADAYYYTYNGISVTGATNEFGPTDVVLSEAFARKAFGNTNPTGMTLRIVNDQSGQLFKVAGVATGKDPNTVPDCYFPVTKPSDNHILYASCSVRQPYPVRQLLPARKDGPEQLPVLIGKDCLARFARQTDKVSGRVGK